MTLEKKWIRLMHVPSEEQLADTMTKALGRIKFVYQRSEIKVEDVGKHLQAGGSDCWKSILKIGNDKLPESFPELIYFYFLPCY